MSSQGLPVIPRESKTTQSLVLALFVHAALVAFLWIGVSWQTEGGSSAEAEVWDIKVSEAAPEAKVPVPEAEVVQEETQQELPKPVAQPQASSETPPDIALKAEEKKKEEKQKEAAKRQEEAQARQKAETKKKEAREKQLKLADQKKADAILAEEARRLAAKSGTGGSGTSAYSTGSVGADAGYIRKVSAKIKSNTLFNVPPGLNGNPPVEYDVELLPDGSIKAMKKRKSSGVPGFDEAVRRAIEKSAPFPPNQAGKVPSRFEVSHKPKG